MSQEKLEQDSGKVKHEDRLTAFLYFLMRDELPPGKVQEILDEIGLPGEEIEYTNGWLANYSKWMADEIIGGS